MVDLDLSNIPTPAEFYRMQEEEREEEREAEREFRRETKDSYYSGKFYGDND